MCRIMPVLKLAYQAVSDPNVSELQQNSSFPEKTGSICKLPLTFLGVNKEASSSMVGCRQSERPANRSLLSLFAYSLESVHVIPFKEPFFCHISPVARSVTVPSPLSIKSFAKAPLLFFVLSKKLNFRSIDLTSSSESCLA